MNTNDSAPPSAAPSINFAAIIARLKLLVTSPASAWEVISSENSVPKIVTLNYILPLLVVGTICSFIGMQVFGVTVPFLGTWRPPLISSLIEHIVIVALQVGGVFVSALILNKISPSFGGNDSYNRAFSLLGYSMLPGLAVRVLEILPALKLLSLPVAIFGFYLFYTGIPTMLGVPQNKRVGFVVVSIIISMLVSFVFGMLGAVVAPTQPLALPS